MTRFEVGIPLSDANGNRVDTTSLQEAMESIALDGLSHNTSLDNRYKVGAWIDQCNVFKWTIQDTALTTAQNNYNTFIASYTFANSPYMHSYSIS